MRKKQIGFEHQIRISDLAYKKFDELKYEYRVKSYTNAFFAMIDENVRIKSQVAELRQQRTMLFDIIHNNNSHISILTPDQTKLIGHLLPQKVDEIKNEN